MMFSLSLSLALAYANRYGKDVKKKKDHDNPDQKERGDSCRDPH